MSKTIRHILYREIVVHSKQAVINVTGNKRDIETIIAEKAAAYKKPKQEIIPDPSAPSIDDVITEDDILSVILSNLTLKEAVATSVVSPRWRYIWTRRPKLSFAVQNMFPDHIKLLFFDDTDSLFVSEDKIEEKNELMLGRIELMLGRTDQFICFVNSIMQQLQLQGRSKIDEFEVRYYLHNIHSHHLDAWVNFAVESKTRVLGVYLHKPIFLDTDEEKYEFPSHLLGSSSSVEELFLTSCSLKPQVNFNGLNNLKKLSLFHVDVTEEDFTHLLSNCYTLEYLKLDDVQQLATLSISNPQNHFQTFIVKDCHQLRGGIKINAINLKNLGYHGYPVDFILGQSSQLSEAFIAFQTEERASGLDFYLNKISRNLPQLRTLTCTIIGDSKVPNFSRAPNVFIHLRRVIWLWRVSDQKMSLWHLATLLEAAPLLEELSLSLGLSAYSFEEAPEQLEKVREDLPEHPHAHLKKLRFFLFFWSNLHVEFTLYLIKNAVELELLWLVNGVVGVDEATTKKLKQELPAKVKLHIDRKC